MITKFYKKALPRQGRYCVVTIDPSLEEGKKIYPNSEWFDSVDDIEPYIQKVNQNKKTNVFVALASFKDDTQSRKGDNAIYHRSFFLDLDVGPSKDYPTKEEAVVAIDEFLGKSNMPPPVIIDSGSGIHAYWLLNEDIPIDEWLVNAENFRNLCEEHEIRFDPAVMEDRARIMRAPDTFNQKPVNWDYKGTEKEPIPTTLLTDVYSYSLEELQEHIGEAKPSLDSILKAAKAPMSEIAKQMSGLNNYATKFLTIRNKSVESDDGCPQLKYMIENRANLSEPEWYAAISIAQQCVDRDYAIHEVSKDHHGYDPAVVEEKAMQADGKPHSCEAIERIRPGGCEGCKHKGKITNPLILGRVFIASPTTDRPIVTEIVPALNGVPMVTTKLHGLPAEIKGYKRAENGGIVFKPDPIYDESGDLIEQREVITTDYDLYPVRRVYSKSEGECFMMHYDLPNDKTREFTLPMSLLGDPGEFRKRLLHYGVNISVKNDQWKYIMDYLGLWARYLIASGKAEDMRNQMGFTPDEDSFVIGGLEIDNTGQEIQSPTSPLCKGIAEHLTKQGSYDLWKQSANKLNTEGLEIHAFILLTGFGSILMKHTQTKGASISLMGDTGAGKTASLYAAQSIWGDPEKLSVATEEGSTNNGLVGRYLALHNIIFGLDELGNIDNRRLSSLIYKISSGKAKIRMQASVNAERDYEMSASLIALFSTNYSLYDILSKERKDPNGEMARLIEFYVRKPKFIKDSPTESVALFDVFRLNYGWAGPEFIKEYFKHSKEALEDRIKKWIIKFKEDFGDNSAFRFYENVVAVTMAAGELAAEADIVNLDLNRIYNRVIGELLDIKDNVIRADDDTNFESYIGEFIISNNGARLTIEGNNLVEEPRLNNLFIRIDKEKNELSLSKPAFRRFLQEQGTSLKKFKHELKLKNINVEEKRKKMAAGWKPGVDEFNVEALIFDMKQLNQTGVLKDIESEPVQRT